MKRALAYSSIENIGLIGLALGVGLWGWASKMPAIAALGMAAGLFHVWNHALMKGLMFLAAGSVLHATGTRDIEKLGGLMKRMPWTGTVMTVGAVAIAALPPLNGFVSKWLMYMSLAKCGLATQGGTSLTALLAVGLLALVGGLAAIALVRLTGIVLLGSPRSEAAGHAHESSPWMLAPMAVLVFLCLTVAVIPQTGAGSIPAVLHQVLGSEASQSFLGLELSEAPLQTLGNMNAWTLIAIGALVVVSLALSRKAAQAKGPTWGCGYVMPTARMQYTGRSFAEMAADHLIPRLLRPRIHQQAPRGVFPSRGDFGSDYPEPIIERIYEPFFWMWADRCSRLRILQQGQLHVYLVYIVFTVVVALAWVSLRR
jgi:NADH:ubiquinone oxidoreductase subunit 5 (subunit L)/multisubunit Na+/H+ antiporter MnhA subunit